MFMNTHDDRVTILSQTQKCNAVQDWRKFGGQNVARTVNDAVFYCIIPWKHEQSIHRFYNRWLDRRIYKTEMKFWAVLGRRGCREKNLSTAISMQRFGVFFKATVNMWDISKIFETYPFTILGMAIWGLLPKRKYKSKKVCIKFTTTDNPFD